MCVLQLEEEAPSPNTSDEPCVKCQCGGGSVLESQETDEKRDERIEGQAFDSRGVL